MKLKPHLAVGLAALLLAACATHVSKPTAQEAATPEARAQQRWDALLAKDYAKAFTYLSPGMRSGMNTENYGQQMQMRPVKWSAAKVIGSDCGDDLADKELCRVNVEVNFSVSGVVPGVKTMDGVSVVEERWIRVDDNWYYVSRQVAIGR